MAKGKHAPNPGEMKTKVLHPNSRKLKKVHKTGVHRSNVEFKNKAGLQRMSSLAEKLIWIKENLPCFVEDDAPVTKEIIQQLILGMFARFDEELEQIQLKKSICKNRRSQHSNRENMIRQTLELEKSDYEGCGLEMPDLIDSENFKYFSNWSGELRFVQNIKLKRFKKSDVEPTKMEI